VQRFSLGRKSHSSDEAPSYRIYGDPTSAANAVKLNAAPRCQLQPSAIKFPHTDVSCAIWERSYFTVCVCTFHFHCHSFSKTMQVEVFLQLFVGSTADLLMKRAKMTKATSGRLKKVQWRLANCHN